MDLFSGEKARPLDFYKFCLAENENHGKNSGFHLDLDTKISVSESQKLVLEEGRSLHNRPYLYTASLVITAGLNIADYFSTREAIKSEELVEGNPFTAMYVENPVIFTAVKIGWTLGHYALMRKLYKKNKKLAWIVSTLSNLVLSYVVANNITLIGRVKKLENR